MNWESDDQDKAVAWQLLESEKCPGCGTRPDEEVTVGTVICQTCRDKHFTESDDRHRRKPGLHITLRRHQHGEPS